MEYTKIVAVTGLPGLFELISSKNDGAVVRSIEDKTTRFISGRIHQFSQLESIEVFTKTDNINLADVFTTMEKNGAGLPDEKDSAAIKKYFERILPDLDFEKVYNSDLKKMIRWFEVLKKNNIEIKLSSPEPPPAEAIEKVKEKKEEPSPEKEEKKSSKKTAVKKK
ncbi:MAG: DUF5606 domain-containing protein [Chitinophagaceae bacterium]|jgi:hypothetical protein|nr:DUF5606 domain-containing protein [Chitinophagaceae bacterium]OQY96852.1 MAG: hypothetical protein B6D37_00890 [Sphingobacteriales bacterium UTBCD1]